MISIKLINSFYSDKKFNFCSCALLLHIEMTDGTVHDIDEALLSSGHYWYFYEDNDEDCTGDIIDICEVNGDWYINNDVLPDSLKPFHKEILKWVRKNIKCDCLCNGYFDNYLKKNKS